MQKFYLYTFIIYLVISVCGAHAQSTIKTDIFASLNIGSTKMDKVGIDNALESFFGAQKQSQSSIFPNNLIEDLGSSYGLDVEIVKLGITKIIGVKLNKPLNYGHYRTITFEYKSGTSKYYLPSGINIFSDPANIDIHYNGLSVLISRGFSNESFQSIWPFFEAGGNLALINIKSNVSSKLLDINTNNFVLLKNVFTKLGVKYGKNKKLASFISYKKFDDNYTEIEVTTSYSINW